MESLIQTFKEKNKRERKPTPHSIFLAVKAGEIFQNLKTIKGSRPDIKEVRQAYKEAWNSISLEDKQMYEEAATALGYVKPSLNLGRRGDFLNKRLSRMNQSINTTK